MGAIVAAKPAEKKKFADFLSSGDKPGFFASGGKWSNIFCTPLSRFLMFLSDLSDTVSLDDPRQTSFFVFESNRSTTSVPTL